MADGAPTGRLGRPTPGGFEDKKAAGGSGRDASAVMMQTTDLWRLSYAALVTGLDLPMLRAIHLQGEVRSPAMVVGDVIGEDPLEMPFVDHDHVVQTVSADCPDQPFDVGILPGRSRRRPHVFDPEVVDRPKKLRFAETGLTYCPAGRISTIRGRSSPITV